MQEYRSVLEIGPQGQASDWLRELIPLFLRLHHRHYRNTQSDQHASSDHNIHPGCCQDCYYHPEPDNGCS